MNRHHFELAVPAVQLLLQRFAAQARFAYRHFPLEEVHPHALAAAEAAECAGAQGQFWAMYEQLFDNQQHLKGANLQAYAARVGLDMTRYAAEMGDHVYLQRVREHQQSGRDSDVRGTPTFFVDGVIRDVSFGMHLLFEAVEAQLASAPLKGR